MLGRSCKRIRLSSCAWQVAHAKSCDPPRMKNKRLPTSYIFRSSIWACGRFNFMPLDSAAIQVASAVTLLCSPLPNGVLAISCASKPCNSCMQVSNRDSKSCTRPVSGKKRGNSTHTPLKTPGPLPKSHFSKLAFLGPRFCVHRPSPFASNRSAGFPSCSICRYSAMLSVDDFCAKAKKDKLIKPIHTIIFFIFVSVVMD